ncbi:MULTISPECIES: zinc dependent phospholipase C family protein [Terrabacteria group]|uniref:zinc dependent phospholipase C family protein n=1 Tax=Bacillati TaxID=1783272 RepID=UPI001C6F432F|nr:MULTISPECIES: zinc dependent phospholipase C family protein [Terrabacteria group]MBW9212245.1 zinc dependent phospholipase C family protein [Trueperella sp. zg.1013]
MPAATTHDIFAKAVYRLYSPSVRQEIPFNALYLLGSQGPDFLFFSSTSFGQLNQLGRRLHREKVKETLEFLTSYQQLNPRLKPYVAGFISHYVLDAFSHPFIDAKAKELNHKNAHIEIESQIDTWSLSQQGLKIQDYRVHKHVHLNHVNKELVATMYQCLFKEIFHVDVKVKKLISCLADFEIGLLLLKPNATKFKWVRRIEKFYGLNPFISSMMLKQDSALDFLNLQHEAIQTELGVSKLSYPEVYGKACVVAASIMNEHLDPYLLCDFNGRPIKKDTND